MNDKLFFLNSAEVKSKLNSDAANSESFSLDLTNKRNGLVNQCFASSDLALSKKGVSFKDLHEKSNTNSDINSPDNQNEFVVNGNKNPQFQTKRIVEF